MADGVQGLLGLPVGTGCWSGSQGSAQPQHLWHNKTFPEQGRLGFMGRAG